MYALYPKADFKRTVKFITALQTISDYLDNLCDRAGVFDENSFRQLHVSMSDAIDPNVKKSDYYKFFPNNDDNGYLNNLVDICREQVSQLPAYRLVMSKMKKYVHLYSKMQSHKHVSPDKREQALSKWALKNVHNCPDVSWWEFSAAAGSTLYIFLLFASASDPFLTAQEVDAMEEAYFPWVCGLHILLDYYIDYQEDMQMGDLNFTYYYNNLKECEERICLFITNSLKYCSRLKYPKFHNTIIKGLLAMYLSDPKAHHGMNRLTTKHLIKKGGLDAQVYYNICRLLRASGKL